MAGFLLLHSPLVGPGTWKPAAEALRAAGHTAATPDLRLSTVTAPYFPALTTRIEDALAAEDVVVAHSGAGALVAGAMARGRARGAIFVDALSPHPGRSWLQSVAPAFAQSLLGRAVEGRLPPWNRWFGDETLARVLPPGELRDGFVAALEPLPLAYFEERAPACAELAPRRTAYLQLSAAYADEARQASQAGWRVRTIAAHHLAMLDQPDRLAHALSDLAHDFPPMEAR